MLVHVEWDSGEGRGRRVLEINGLQMSDLRDIVDVKEDVRKHREE